jgi:hypothetical protein
VAESNHTSKRFYGPAQPGTTATNLFQVAVSRRAVLRHIVIANTTDLDAWVSFSIGTTGIDTAASRIADKLQVPAISTNSHGLIDWEPGLVLEAAEYLVAKQQTASALTVTVSGVEITV